MGMTVLHVYAHVSCACMRVCVAAWSIRACALSLLYVNF